MNKKQKYVPIPLDELLQLMQVCYNHGEKGNQKILDNLKNLYKESFAKF